jgi:ADP-ribosylglycohydrolase
MAAETVFETVPRSPEEQYFSRIAGALIGSAAADALGWITEFVRGPDHLKKIYRTDRVTDYRSWQKTTGGRFNAYIDYISAGEYSDDTQLSLAVARSLRPDGSVDVNHLAKVEFPLWLDYARGAGSTITGAARALQKRSADWNSNFFRYRHRGVEQDFRDAGANGAAMRVAPIALANLDDADQMNASVWQASICTHGHPRAIFGALLLAEAIRRCAVEGLASRATLLDDLSDFAAQSRPPANEDFQLWLSRWNQAGRDFGRVWEATRQEVLDGLASLRGVEDAAGARRRMDELGCFRPESKGSGTATVLAGIAIFLGVGNSFREAVLLAVNALGSDTDTIGGFVGAMCGAAHGYDEVPPEWASTMQDYYYFMRVATEIARIACRTGVGGQALLPAPRGRGSDVPDLVGRLRSHDISQGERVFHPLFGTGWVKSVDAQRLRRKDGATVVLAWVSFDIGQSCKFRFMAIPSARRAAKPQRPAGPSSLF